MDDLPSLDPELYQGLIYLKNYKGDVESDLSLNFTVVDNGNIIFLNLVTIVDIEFFFKICIFFCKQNLVNPELLILFQEEVTYRLLMRLAFVIYITWRIID